MFWEPNLYDFEQQSDNDKIFSFVTLCIRLYIAFLLMICVLYFARPLLLAKVVNLPWGSSCSIFFHYKVCYVYEVIQLPILILTQVSFDTLFISMITNIICEFKLVRHRFPILKINPALQGTDKEAMEELRTLVDHHNLILG